MFYKRNRVIEGSQAGLQKKHTQKKVSSLKLSKAPETCIDARPIFRGFAVRFRGGGGSTTWHGMKKSCTTWHVWNSIQKSQPRLTNISTGEPDFWTINIFPTPERCGTLLVASSKLQPRGLFESPQPELSDALVTSAFLAWMVDGDFVCYLFGGEKCNFGHL